MKPEFELFAQAAVPHPCCVPSKQRAMQLAASRSASAARTRAKSGSTEGMIKLDGGAFLMGTNVTEGFPQDGEGPAREVILDSFYMDVCPVTNVQMEEFVQATGYRTEAERFGWSFVFQGHIQAERYAEIVERQVLGANWW